MIKTRTLYIPEILDLVDGSASPKLRAKVLVENRSPALGTILALTYDVNKFKMILTPEQVDEALAMPYKKERAELGTCPTHLYKEYKRLILFVKSNERASLDKKKLQHMVVQLRESLHPSEFDVVVRMLKREQQAKGLTVRLLEDTFPNLLSK